MGCVLGPDRLDGGAITVSKDADEGLLVCAKAFTGLVNYIYIGGGYD